MNMNMKRLQLLFSTLFSTISVVKARYTELWFGATDNCYKYGLYCEGPVFLMITNTNQPATVQLFISSALITTVNIHVNYKL